jgi:hypothetical protein
LIVWSHEKDSAGGFATGRAVGGRARAVVGLSDAQPERLVRAAAYAHTPETVAAGPTEPARTSVAHGEGLSGERAPIAVATSVTGRERQQRRAYLERSTVRPAVGVVHADLAVFAQKAGLVDPVVEVWPADSKVQALAGVAVGHRGAADPWALGEVGRWTGGTAAESDVGGLAVLEENRPTSRARGTRKPVHTGQSISRPTRDEQGGKR